MYKALVSDFDGTLASDDKSVTSENLEAIRKLLDSGKHFALCTGRMTESAKMIIKNLPFKPLVATHNGCEIFDSSTGEVLVKHCLKPEILLKLIEYGKSQNAHYHIFDDEVVVEEIDEVTEFYCNICKVNPREVGDLYEYVKNTGATSPKFMLININGGLEKNIEDIKRLFGEEVEVMKCYEGMLDVTPKGIDKGFATRELARLWGISEKECVCVGDEGNDVAMLKTAGVGVCMKNADDWVKKEADYVTINDNNSSGVAEVIYKFLLSGEKK